MTIFPLKHYILPRDTSILSDPYIVASIGARVADTTDKLICNAILEEAKAAGITDLYLIDRKFVMEALMEKLDRDRREHEADPEKLSAMDMEFPSCLRHLSPKEYNIRLFGKWHCTKKEDNAMDKLQQLLESFRNDKENTTYKNGTRRFDKEIAWIEEMIPSYAAALNMTIDEVVDIMEKGRNYWWPNYYQPCNFPPLDSNNLIGVFKTYEEFRTHSYEHWQGYRCPKCGTISPHPQECLHRQQKDGKCDWCSYGLFKSYKSVIILEEGLKAIPIFEPVPKEGT